MYDIELGVFENAIDSLNECLRKFRAGKDEPREYKFAILHLFHFAELFLKSNVAQESELLVFRNPQKVLSEKSATINLHEAVQLLANLGFSIDKSLRAALEVLSANRNKIQHFKCEFGESEAETLIGRVIHEFIIFDNENRCTGFSNEVADEFQELIGYLEQGAITHLDHALAKVEVLSKEAHSGLSPKEYFLSGFDNYFCDQCGNETLVPHEVGIHGWLCTFCGDEPRIAYECARCGEDVNNPHDRQEVYPYCSYCNHKISKGE